MGQRSAPTAHESAAWLLCDQRVLASLEVAHSGRARRRGLLGRDEAVGALLLERTRWVHTLGMRFPIDVAFLDSSDRVVKLVTMKPHRIGVPFVGARRVLEAEAGAFSRWSLKLGDQLEVRHT